MPFQSKAQQRFAYAHPEKFGGAAGLKEWSAATDFSKIPERKDEHRKAYVSRMKARKHGSRS
jgi:hypothetical protein